jgi:hypothetical protein
MVLQRLCRGCRFLWTHKGNTRCIRVLNMLLLPSGVLKNEKETTIRSQKGNL